jgi:hypothetical protein
MRKMVFYSMIGVRMKIRVIEQASKQKDETCGYAPHARMPHAHAPTDGIEE